MVATVDPTDQVIELDEANTAAASVEILASGADLDRRPPISEDNSTVVGGLRQVVFRADDGAVYQVLLASNLPQGAESIRITSVAPGTSGVQACSDGGGVFGEPASAGSGTASAADLFPYQHVRRSLRVHPNDIDAVGFDRSFGGRVTLGRPGASALNFCHDAFDCQGRENLQTLAELTVGADGIPAACIARSFPSGCDYRTLYSFAFGATATTGPPYCDEPYEDPANTTVCATRPAGGFSLGQGEAMVFVYEPDIAGSFQVGVGGFLVDEDGVNSPNCPANTVFAPVASVVNAPPPRFSPTPTSAFSPTAIPTDTPYNTRTPRRTGTPTPATPVSSSRTPMPTATSTPTFSPDPFEPDDVLADAKLIACNTARTQSLLPGGDIDWVRLPLDGRTGISVSAPRGVSLALFDAVGNALTANSQSLGIDCTSAWLAGPGFLRVQADPSAGALGPEQRYALGVACFDCPP
jgi:hypothetical protein